MNLNLLESFEDNWFGIPGCRSRDARSQPIFAVNLWNTYDATFHDMPNTNTLVAGWHHRLSCLELVVHRHGNSERPLKDTAARISTIEKDHDNRPLLDYLRGFGHNKNLEV
ncbi:hypothetical protein CHS0354_034634 [Potamilus streckersoni]|uniref:Uncharacterized protein n=1 Tax=Potamilus streckersoni TaxID=2493646 RepID=A0AAE0TC99_9BIVA|nr:hypothetical protein CHS0354_034634 [Potamilus streckersoni]